MELVNDRQIKKLKKSDEYAVCLIDNNILSSKENLKLIKIKFNIIKKEVFHMYIGVGLKN